MTDKEVLRKRWWAFLLGEAPPEECGAIQAEIERNPEEAALLRHVIDETAGWAKEPVPYTPAHLEFLDSEEGGAGGKSVRPWRLPVRKGALATAAVILFALAASQVRFSATVGTLTVQWRQEPAESALPGSEELLSLAARVRSLEQASAMAATHIQLLAADNEEIRKQFGAAAVRLAYNQRADTAALTKEIQELLFLTGGRASQNAVPSNAQ